VLTPTDLSTDPRTDLCAEPMDPRTDPRTGLRTGLPTDPTDLCTDLTDGTAADFARDGYAVLPGFLEPAELDLVRDAVVRRVERPDGETCARPNNTLVPLRWDDPIVAALVTGGRTSRLAAAVAADDLRWISGYVSAKEPRSLPLWWHQDWWCWDHPVSFRRESAQVALLCYLADCDTHTGALRVLPGSHTSSHPMHAILPAAHRDESTALDPAHAAMADQPGQVTIAVRAGDAVVTDYRLLHGTHANCADHRRDCVLLSFTPSWTSLPADVRAHLISHPALPAADETRPAAGWAADLLPVHTGPRRDLALNRDAPAELAQA
jgi:hypothetical protein